MYFQLKPFSFFALLPSSSPSCYIFLTEVLMATWMEKLSWLSMKTNILSGFKLFRWILFFNSFLSVCLNTQKQMYSQQWWNKSNNRYSVLQQIPKRNKCSAYEKMIGALLALFFFLSSWNHFWKEKKKESNMDYSNKIDSYYSLSSISKVNTENNFKWTNLSLRTWMLLIHF